MGGEGSKFSIYFAQDCGTQSSEVTSSALLPFVLIETKTVFIDSLLELLHDNVIYKYKIR